MQMHCHLFWGIVAVVLYNKIIYDPVPVTSCLKALESSVPIAWHNILLLLWVNPWITHTFLTGNTHAPNSTVHRIRGRTHLMP
jgi:hypothetical protein